MHRLGEIGVPNLLVGGRYDECTPSHLAAMHQRIRGSQLRIIEDASHLCFAEQPAEFAEIAVPTLLAWRTATTGPAPSASPWPPCNQRDPRLP